MENISQEQVQQVQEVVQFEVKRNSSNVPVVHFKAKRPISGSSKYPDPEDGALEIQKAGYICAINRDSAVIARPAKAKVVWVKVEPDSLRGILFEMKGQTDAIAKLLSEAIEAFNAEELLIASELEARRKLAADGNTGKLQSPSVLTAISFLEKLSVADREAVFERFGYVCSRSDG